MGKVLENDMIRINEPQDSRFWIHSEELGYGCWVRNDILKELVKNKGSFNLNKEPSE